VATTLLDDLKRDIAEGRVTVIVGAGVSMAATYDPARRPNVAAWTGLLESGVDECVKVAQPLPKGWEERVRDEIASGDLDELLSAAEKISRRLGAPAGGAYGKWLREKVGSLRIRHPEVPAALCNLGLPLLTTNYDGVLEEASHRTALTWRDGGMVERVIRGEDASIVHLHGHCVTQLGEDVLTALRSYAGTRPLPFAVPGREMELHDRSEDDARALLQSVPGLCEFALWFSHHASSIDLRVYERMRPNQLPVLTFYLHDRQTWKSKLDTLAKITTGSEISVVLATQPYTPHNGEPYDLLRVEISGPHDILRYLADDCEAVWT
jgi:hypothetical protein